jgi:hypothetical protein
MSARNLVLSGTSVLAFLLASSSLQAQEPTDAAQPDADTRQQLPSVMDRLALLESQVQQLARILGVQIPVPARPIAPSFPGEDVNGQASSAQQLAGLAEGSRQINDRLGRIQGQLDELRSAVMPSAPVVPTHGTLVIRNWTGVSQYISVNGRQFYVRPGLTTVTVPHAIVEVYLPGFEMPKLMGVSNWRRTGRGYEMPLDIRI